MTTTPANLEQQKPKVLIVDDERFHVTMLNGLLRDDHTVMVASSGEQALKAALTQPPDLILLDVEMPGMGGFEVLKQLKNDPFTEGIPVIFITALSDADDETRGLEAGAGERAARTDAFAGAFLAAATRGAETRACGRRSSSDTAVLRL